MFVRAWCALQINNLRIATFKAGGEGGERMATPGSRLAAVLRAGQAKLAATGGGLPYAKASWRKTKAELDALAAKRRKERADELYAQCIREMTEAQEMYKRSVRPETLAQWEREGRVFPDPVAVALMVYDCVMNGEEEDALYYIRHNVERSLYPPQTVEEQEREREEELLTRQLQRQLFPSDDEGEGEEDVVILDAWEVKDDDGAPDASLFGGDYDGNDDDDRDSNATVEYGARSGGDDEEVMEVDEDPDYPRVSLKFTGKRGAPSPEQEDDAAMARRLQAEWNSRGGGRARERPSRMVPSMEGKNSGRVKEERR